MRQEEAHRARSGRSGYRAQIFDLYLQGHAGEEFGHKAIAAYLNARSLSYRGKPWTKTKVYQVLHHTACRGELVFNKTVHKTKKTKPESEWISTSVEPIIDAETFAEARRRAAGRPPRTSRREW